MVHGRVRGRGDAVDAGHPRRIRPGRRRGRSEQLGGGFEGASRLAPTGPRATAFCLTLVPALPRSRGARRSSRTDFISRRLFLSAQGRSHASNNPRPRRLSTPSTDAFELRPDVDRFALTLDPRRELRRSCVA